MTTVDEKLFHAQLVRNMRASILEARAATDTKIDELEVHVAQARVIPRPSSFRRAPAGVGT
jgi:hypothetical protein